MLRTRCLLAAVAALAVLVLTQMDAPAWPPPAKGQTKQNPTAARKAGTGAPHASGRGRHAHRKAGHRRYVVQVRHPNWIRKGPMTRQAAAGAAAGWRRAGWSTRSRNVSGGVIVARRMRHWHTRATVHQPHA